MNAMFNESYSFIQKDTIKQTKSYNTIDEVHSLRNNGRRFGSFKINDEIFLEVWEFNNFFTLKTNVLLLG